MNDEQAARDFSDRVTAVLQRFFEQNGRPAPTQQQGSPPLVESGAAIRFGDVDLTYLNVTDFAELIKALV